MKKFLVLLLFLLLILSCNAGGDEKGLKTAPNDSSKNPDSALVVGFSQMNHINPWRVAETNDLKREAGERGIKLLLTDAESSQEQQILDIKDLLAQGADYIVCAPLIFTGYEEAFEACRNAGVPLIMLDREVDGEPGKDFLTFVGSDFVAEAKRAAHWLAEKTDRKARVIELQGRFGASCVIDREKGFREVLETIPGMETVKSVYADFERIKGQKMMEEIILSFGKDFNAVYAHNDEMAIGAIQALKAANLRPGIDVTIISIDGSKDAIKSIIAGELGATVECTPRLAKKVFDAIEAHERGEKVPPKILVDDRLFDKSNALDYINEAF